MRNKPIAMVEFDEKARLEYITGFRKRKQQRIKEKKERYLQREKQERKETKLETRKRRKDLIAGALETIEAIEKSKQESRSSMSTIVQGENTVTVTIEEM